MCGESYDAIIDLVTESRPEATAPKPLDGVRVVELAGFVAAPSAGVILAELGADVIKIELPTGDPYRGLMRPPKIDGHRVDFDAAFSVDNRGKRSLALDVSTDEGQRIVKRLISTAQIFMCNMLPRRQQRYGLDPDSLRTVNPSLVHATLTGYGTRSEEADRPGYDVTAFFARGGFADLCADPETGQPSRFPQAAGDHATGLALLSGILAALRLAERTGQFQEVETSLLSNAYWQIAGDLSTTLVDGRRPTPRARHQVPNAAVNSYRCGDGRWVMVNMPVPAAYPEFCRCLGIEWVLDDDRFVTPRDRFVNMAALVPIVEDAMATRPAGEWGEIFDRSAIVWALIRTLDEVVKDKQARVNGYFVSLQHRLDTDGEVPVVVDGDRGSPIETVAVPIKIHGVDLVPGGPVPAVGANSDEILAGIGLDGDEIARLRDQGIIR